MKYRLLASMALMLTSSLFLNHAVAQNAKFGLSVIGNINNGTTHFTGIKGNWLVDGSATNFNIGIEPHVNLYFSKEENKNLFLHVGARFLTNRADFELKEPAESPILKQALWQSITVPVYLGNTFKIGQRGNVFLDVFAGGSLGASFGSVRSETFIIDGVTTGTSVDPAKLTGSLEAGFNITPFINNPNLTIGFTYSQFIQSSTNVNYNYLNLKTGGNYSFSANRNFHNYMVVIGYTFGTKWREHFRWVSPLQCN